MSSEYSREIKKNEGYAVFSATFAICSPWFGLIGNGVPEVGWCGAICGLLGMIMGVLGVTDKRAKKKDTCWLAIIIAPIGTYVSVDGLFWGKLAAAWNSF